MLFLTLIAMIVSTLIGALWVMRDQNTKALSSWWMVAKMFGTTLGFWLVIVFLFFLKRFMV